MKAHRLLTSVRLLSWLVAAALPLSIFAPAPVAARGGPFPVTTIYTNIPGHPSAEVPGYPGVHFGPGTGTTHFDRPFGSPNGNWILSADTDLATTNDEVILVNDVVQIFEGDPAPWAGGELVGLIDTRLAINDAGDWVFATNTDGPTTADEYMVRVSAGGVYTAAAREGDPVPALPGATWGSIIESGVIAADGTVGLSSDILSGVPITQDDILVLGATLLAQEGVTVPPGQLGAEFWENFNLDDYWIAADGGDWLVQGDLTGDTNTDGVVAVDGTVVVQEGVILPGAGFANPVDTAGIVGVHMAPNGDWFVRGNNDLTEQDWVYSNGALLAASGQPIHLGATEVFTDAEFTDTFFLHVGDSNGNFVIGGVSDGPTLANGVLVANNTAVIARESDQLDLDNDGTPDDAYFNTFGNDDGYLADDGAFYVTATIKDGTGTILGQGFFSIDISSLTNPNTPPALTNVAATSPIDENDSTTLTGGIADPDPGDTFTLVADWGDGSVLTYTYPAGTTTFTETHPYLDDHPTGTPSDVYTVTLTLSDSSGGASGGAATVTVNNVAPTAEAGPDQSLTLGDPAAFGGSFSDPGTLDSHTIEWDFGDGNQASGTLTPTHTYTSAGTYTVTLTVTDDDTGVGVDTLQVTVNEISYTLYLPAVLSQP